MQCFSFLSVGALSQNDMTNKKSHPEDTPVHKKIHPEDMETLVNKQIHPEDMESLVGKKSHTGNKSKTTAFHN